MVKRIYLWDQEDDTTLTVEVDKRYSGLEMWFTGPKTSIYKLIGSERCYGVVDKKIMYRFCKQMINQLDKEGVVV